MASPFDNLNDEQLLAMIREASKEGGGHEEAKPPAFKVTLGDGSVLEADSQDNLNKAIQAKLEDAIRSSRTENAPVQTPTAPGPAKPEWNMETFVKKFTTDPREGMEYYEVANYGMPVGKAVPQMLAGMLAMAQELQELKTAQFAPQVPEERKAVEQIMRERNWQPSRQSFQDAADIARARGLFKAKEEEPQVPKTFIPPRVNRSAEDPNADAEILRNVDRLTDEQIEDLLVKAGHLKTRRL